LGAAGNHLKLAFDKEADAAKQPQYRDEFLRHFRKAVELAPDDPRSWYWKLWVAGFLQPDAGATKAAKAKAAAGWAEVYRCAAEATADMTAAQLRRYGWRLGPGLGHSEARWD
jgi:hypothetical protein